jgi:hypothetical protein
MGLMNVYRMYTLASSSIAYRRAYRVEEQDCHMQNSEEAKSGHMIVFLLVRSHHVRARNVSIYLRLLFAYIRDLSLVYVTREHLLGSIPRLSPPSRRRHEIARVWRSLGHPESYHTARDVYVMQL